MMYKPSKSHWEALISMGYIRKTKTIEGITYVTNGRKWGAMDYENIPIIPIEYDFVDVDEYEYAHFWIVCGRGGYHYMNNDTIKYSGVFDIYDFEGNLVLKGLESYNVNYPIMIIMNDD